MERKKYIDVARGIAIFCIILGHLGIAWINRIVFTFHVPIFYFITGYFLNRKRSIKEMFRKQCKTLIVPYIVTCFCVVMMGMIMDCRWYGPERVKLSFLKWTYAALYGSGDDFKEPFVIERIGAIWFLLSTFWGSILLRISLDFRKWTRIIFLCILFCLGYWTRIRFFWFPLSIQAGMCSALFMYLGYLVRHSEEEIKQLPDEAKTVCLIGAVIVWYCFIRDFQSFWLVHNDFGRGIIDIFGCICACLVVLCISKQINIYLPKLSDSLGFFGKNSLIVLCVHLIEQNTVAWWRLSVFLTEKGLPDLIGDLCAVLCKFLFIIILTVVIAKNRSIQAFLHDRRTA